MTDTMARLMPHLPAHLQHLLGPDQVRDALPLLASSGAAIHIRSDVYRKLRRGLDVESAARLASRAADPELLTELAEDRRTGVRDALSANPHLPPEVAADLLRQTLSERVGRSSGLRWQRLAHLTARALRGGNADASGAIRNLAELRGSGPERADAMPLEAALPLLREIGGDIICELIADGTLSTLLDLTPLHILHRAHGIAGPHPWGAEATLAAIEAESGDSLAWTSVRRTDRVIDDPTSLRTLIVRISDPERAGRIARNLHRIDAKTGAAVIADLLDRHEGDAASALHRALRLDHAMFSAALRSRSAEGETLTVRPETVEALTLVRLPEHRQHNLANLLDDAGTAVLPDDALQHLQRMPHTIGSDLLVVLAALRGDGGPALEGRLQQVDLAALTAGEWQGERDRTAGTVAGLLLRASGGNTALLARNAAIIAESAGRHTRAAAQAEAVIRRLLERRDLSLADLAEQAGDATVDVLADLLGERYGSRSALRRIRRGDLGRAPHGIRVRLVAAMLRNLRGDHPAHPLLDDRALRRADVLVPAIVQAGAVREALGGSGRIPVDAATAAAIADACLDSRGWDRGRELQQLAAGSAQTLARTGTLPWAGALADRIPLQELRRATRSDERAGAVEAAVLLHAAGDDSEDWKILTRLADTWEGTARELAMTVRTLNPRTDPDGDAS